MKVLFNKKFQKFIEKLKNKGLYDKIKSEVDNAIKNPSVGKILEHPFRKYKIQSLPFVYEEGSFRIAYIVNRDKDEIVFLLIDSRENFYKKLERIL